MAIGPSNKTRRQLQNKQFGIFLSRQSEATFLLPQITHHPDSAMMPLHSLSRQVSSVRVRAEKMKVLHPYHPPVKLYDELRGSVEISIRFSRVHGPPTSFPPPTSSSTTTIPPSPLLLAGSKFIPSQKPPGL